MSLKYLLTDHEVFILNPTAFRILCTTPRNFRAAKSSKARLMHRQSNTLVTYNKKKFRRLSLLNSKISCSSDKVVVS